MPIIEQDFMELTKDLDLSGFWEENAACQRFTRDKTRCAVSFAPDDHWIFEFESVPSTLRYYQDKQYRDDLHRAVNSVTEEHLGTTFFSEDTWEHEPKRIENLFRCEFSYQEGGTPWFSPVTRDPAEFAAILDEAESTDMARWALPPGYREEWDRRAAAGKEMPDLGTGSRGPGTIMSSILDPTDLFIWMYDHPDLMHRFRDILAAKMVELNTFFREFSGNDSPGWWITDDNSALFNPDLYAEYCVPVLTAVLDAMAPLGLDPPAWRYQHSDSAMGHLLDQQYALGIREVNYGPEVDPGLIREKMPDAYIVGQMPPFLLRNGTPEEIREKVIYDFQAAGETGGLEIATAGSVAAGTGIGRMRWLMKLTRDECRYDRR
jgi:uroporphyrinogen decarboxylase